jgi:hypothetical protein
LPFISKVKIEILGYFESWSEKTRTDLSTWVDPDVLAAFVKPTSS